MYGLEIKGRRKLYASIERTLSSSEQRFQKLEFQAKLPITVDDIGYIFEDLNYGRSTFPNQVVLAKPYAVRWDRNRELEDDNVVILGQAEAEKHEKECLIGGKGLEEVWGKEIVGIVERRSEEARRVRSWRRG